MWKGLLATLAVCWLSVTPVLAQDNLGKRWAAAERYAEVFGFDQTLDNLIVEYAQNQRPEHRQLFLALMRRVLDRAKLRSLMVTSMTVYFTADELEALADFYGSPLGKSIVMKYPKFMAQVMPTVNDHLIEAGKKVAEEIQKSK